jgi:acyl-CoA synthetase (AMP-forming)/AMP-acid ligase II
VPVAYVALCEVDASDEAGGDTDAAVVAGETADRIKKSLERDLVRAKRPVTLFIVEALPAGPTGKVKRRMLGTPEVPVLYSFDLR